MSVLEFVFDWLKTDLIPPPPPNPESKKSRTEWTTDYKVCVCVCARKHVCVRVCVCVCAGILNIKNIKKIEEERSEMYLEFSAMKDQE